MIFTYDQVTAESADYYVAEIIFWHSLVWSTQGRTAYPYHLYIRYISLFSLTSVLINMLNLFVPDVTKWVRNNLKEHDRLENTIEKIWLTVKWTTRKFLSGDMSGYARGKVSKNIDSYYMNHRGSRKILLIGTSMVFETLMQGKAALSCAPFI